MLAIPTAGLFLQFISPDPNSIAFARSGAVLVMFTVLVVWSNHTNQRKVSEAKNKLQRRDEIKAELKEVFPIEKIKEILSKPRQVEHQEGRPIRGGSHDGILRELTERLDAEHEGKKKEIESTIQLHQDEISTGSTIASNINVAELLGGLTGTFIWGYGDWLGQSLSAWLKSCL